MFSPPRSLVPLHRYIFILLIFRDTNKLPSHPTHDFFLAGLNLTLERDVDKDLLGLQLRMQYASRKDGSWLANSKKLDCIERDDSDVCTLPFFIVPRVAHGKAYISYFLSALLFLAPYMLSVKNTFVATYLSVSKND